VRAAHAALALLGTVAALAEGQVRPRPGQRPPARDSAPAAAPRMPSAGRQVSDTTAADTSAVFAAPDSVMAALLRRPGYSVTRYEGDLVTYDALSRAFAIAAGTARSAQVEREGQHVSTDSLIVYRDDQDRVDVSGRFRITPGGGQPPLVGSGTASYDLTERSGRLTNAQVTVEESGERWFIESEIGKVMQGDSLRGVATRYYGIGGTLTSCEDSVPDYHFRLKEIKRTDRTLVARPAVMYLKDIPVLWLPFVFQDIRPGRRSGVLPMRFGFSDIVRNNPQYRRHIENIGYYWSINDYMDAAGWLDWRSAAGGDSLDPGWYKFTGEFKYTWLARFLSGSLAGSYQKQGDGLDNLAVSWGHQQKLGRDRNFRTDVNYVTSARLQRQNSFNPYQALATIRSSFSYSDKIGPMSLQLGGDRSQSPTLSLTTAPLELAPWLVWTPGLNFRETQNLRIDQPGTFTHQYTLRPDGTLDSTRLKRNRYDRTAGFDTPLRIHGFELRNSVSIRDEYWDFPEQVLVYPGADSSRKETRVFRQRFRTNVDWNPMFTLPPFFQNRFKLTPSVTLQNVDPGSFWVRSEMSGGRFVHQSKRLVYGVSAAPTVYGLFPGFGPFSRLRHSVSPSVSYSYAPRARVSDEYLEATNRFRQGYLGSLPQSSVSLGLSQNIEAKVAAPGDSASAGRENKLKLLSMNFTPLSYDFERARAVGRSLAGLTTENFGTRLTSDLLPGFDLSLDYSLFQGSTLSDTAEFSPFLTRVSSRFRVGQNENPLSMITRLFGRAVPDQGPQPQPTGALGRTAQEERMIRELAAQPVAGQGARSTQFVVPPTQGWEAELNFSTTRARRPRGGNVIDYDPRVQCEPFRLIDQLAYDNCQNRPSGAFEAPIQAGIGAPHIHVPNQTSLSGSLNFELTQHWAAAWQTSYDFERSQFASHVVSLQRDLHDFRAIFAFTQSPNGNFAFNFFIALKPQPELKFDYSRATIRNR
jgi:hypothetical protein